MGFACGVVGSWVIADLWVMVCKSPPTELVDQKKYGLKGIMGMDYEGFDCIGSSDPHFIYSRFVLDRGRSPNLSVSIVLP
jgi:hypothetical protein